MKSCISPRRFFLAGSKKPKAQSGDKECKNDHPSGETLFTPQPRSPGLTSSRSMPIIRKSSLSKPSFPRRKSNAFVKWADECAGETQDESSQPQLAQRPKRAPNSLLSASDSSTLSAVNSTDSNHTAPSDTSCTSVPTAESGNAPPLPPQAMEPSLPVESAFETYMRYLEQGVIYGDHCSALPIPLTCLLGVPCPPRLARRLHLHRWSLATIFALLGANVAGVVVLLIRAFDDVWAAIDGFSGMKLTRLGLVAILTAIVFVLWVVTVFWTQVEWAHGRRSSTLLFSHRLLFV